MSALEEVHSGSEVPPVSPSSQCCRCTVSVSVPNADPGASNAAVYLATVDTLTSAMRPTNSTVLPGKFPSARAAVELPTVPLFSPVPMLVPSLKTVIVEPERTKAQWFHEPTV